MEKGSQLIMRSFFQTMAVTSCLVRKNGKGQRDKEGISRSKLSMHIAVKSSYMAAILR